MPKPSNTISAMQEWYDMTIPSFVNQMSQLAGPLPALGCQDRLLSFETMFERAQRVACYLIENDIGLGERVLFLMPPGDDWAAAHYGAIMAGALVIPVNLELTENELRYILDTVPPVVIICREIYRGDPLAERLEGICKQLTTDNYSKHEGKSGTLRLALLSSTSETNQREGLWRSLDEAFVYEPSAANLASLEERQRQIHPETSCAIVFTSGSTGNPKPALLHHRGLLGASWWYGESFGIEPGDRVLSPSPTFHVSGISAGMMVSHIRGLPTWLMDAYDPGEALDIIEKYEITTFTGFDTIFTTMLSHPKFSPERVASIRKLIMATGPAMYDRVQAAFPNLETVARCYAMTEMCGPGAITTPDETSLQARKYSNGRPLPGVSITIIDPETDRPVATNERGEIRLMGWNLFNGYLGADEAEAGVYDSEGRFRSGDIGRIDETGMLYLEGRLKQMIKTGGENVSEREVEMFLEDKVSGVSLAQVVGIPDSHWGEAVIAFVELVEESDLDEKLLRDACRGQIASFKIPKKVIFVGQDDWPRTGSGKISKGELRTIAQRASQRPA